MSSSQWVEQFRDGFLFLIATLMFSALVIAVLMTAYTISNFKGF